MRKLTLLFVLLCSLYSQSQTIQGYTYLNSVAVQASGANPGVNIIGSGAAFHKIVWNVSGGTFSACQVQIDSSADGSSFTGAGVLASQACTSNGNAISSSVITNYMRINVTSLTSSGGTPVLTVVVYGYVNNPTSGGGSGTVSTCGPGNAVYTGSGTTVTCDPLITDTSLNGTLNFAQGSIVGSLPYLTQTATWNAGAVNFINLSSNITCTAAAIGSKLFDFLIASASQFSLGFAAVNCAGPRIQVPDGTNTQASFGFGSETAGHGLFKNGADDWCVTNAVNCFFRIRSTIGVELTSAESYGWAASSNAATALDTCLDRQAAGVVRFDANSGCSDGLGKAQSQLFVTTTNCASSGGTCGAASSGSVTIAAAATTVTVATTAVAANSIILVTEDATLGTKLSVTCNTTTGRTYAITTRTAATSFVITTSAAPATNPACLNYLVMSQ